MNKMKTKINITNFLTKGFVLAAFAVSLMINTSAQKTQDFANSDKFTSVMMLSGDYTGDNGKNAASVAPVKKAYSDNSLEAFLMKAAGINNSVAELENKNSGINTTDETNSLENFLFNAAGIDKIVPANVDLNVTVSDKDLENFLLHAADLDANKNCILSNDSATDDQDLDLSDFLLKAASLDMNPLTMD